MKHKKDIVFLCQFFYPEYISSAQLPFDTAAALATSLENRARKLTLVDIARL